MWLTVRKIKNDQYIEEVTQVKKKRPESVGHAVF